MKNDERTNDIWRYAQGILWVLIITAGFFSYDIYHVLRLFAKVTATYAYINNETLWYIVLIYFTVKYLHYYSKDTEMISREVIDDALLTNVMITGIAYYPFPLQYMFVKFPDGGFVPTVLIIYFGYFLKSLAGLFLMFSVLRFFFAGDKLAFVRLVMVMRRIFGDDSSDDKPETSDTENHQHM